MKTTILTVLVLSLCARGSQTDYVAKTKRVDDFRVIVTCSNGADPTGFSLGHNAIVITCTDERAK